MNYPSGNNRVGYSLKAAGNRFFVGINPVDSSEIPNQFVQATTDEVSEACDLAAKAFPVYAQLDLTVRQQFVDFIVQEIRANQDRLMELMSLETGLPLARAKTELNRSVFQFQQYFGAIADKSALEIKIDEPRPELNGMRNFDLRKMNIPLGPVVVFGSSNFPFAYSTLGGDVASALAAGCPVIVKAHPMHPNTSALSADCILAAARKANLPDGVFSHLNASDYQVGEQLLKNEEVKAVGFTGSIAGGTALLKLAQERRIPIPVYAEMGSVNPVVVFEDAMLHNSAEIVNKLADSIAVNAGQFCTSPGIIFLEDGPSANQFAEDLVSKLKTFGPQCMLGPSILKNYQKRKEEIAARFPLRLDGEITGNFIKPSVVEVNVEQFIPEKVLQDEVFGAFVCIVRCRNIEDIKAGIHILDGQLTGSVFTNKEEDMKAIQFELQSRIGRLIINGVPTGVEVSFAQQHGGPFPSSSSSQTAVGQDAVKRFLRPVTFQNLPVEWQSNLLRKLN